MAKEKITVAETNAFIAQAKSVLSDEDRFEVINMIASNPKCGDVMKGTGGVRKVRVSLQGRGKSGGARVVYFYHNDEMPIFLFAVFAKNEKDNLTKTECNELKKVTAQIVKEWKKGNQNDRL
ncbi:MAG: addiction module toxin RelE [Rhodospirillaceae bacterium]|nr:MAG: addiction module toxin RelE [Rhodospirillaceae bacterium]